MQECIDGEGAVQRLAAELRALRRECGSPSFRELARRAHFSSSTLAEAVQGRRLPSQPVVEAFAKACGADPGTWVTRWQEAAAAVTVPEATGPGPEREPTDQVRNRPASPAPDPVHDLGPAARTRGSPRWRGAVTTTVVAGLAAFAGAVGGWAAASATGPSSAAVSIRSTAAGSTGTAGPGGPVPMDGADPGSEGCGDDAQVAARSPLVRTGRRLGVLELRYSPHCQAGWARFYVVPGGEPAMVEVRIESQDGRAASFSYRASVDLPVYTDLIHPEGTCLRAVVAVSRDQQLITETTPCLLPHP